jgi:hypothetical protein
MIAVEVRGQTVTQLPTALVTKARITLSLHESKDITQV